MADPMRFDLVITDQTMPNFTGMDLAKQFLEIRPDIPVVVCTGFSFHTLEKEAKDLGIKSLVKKPLGIRELAEIVTKEIGFSGTRGAFHEKPSRN